MNHQSELIRAGWTLALSRDRRGYLARARRGADRVEGLASMPDAACQRAWEAAEQLHPTFECDLCDATTEDLRDLTTLGNAQVCEHCYMTEEQSAYHNDSYPCSGSSYAEK